MSELEVEVEEEPNICADCAADRRAEGLDPVVKTLLPFGTMRNNLEVWVCHNCDGPLVIEYAGRPR